MSDRHLPFPSHNFVGGRFVCGCLLNYHTYLCLSIHSTCQADAESISVRPDVFQIVNGPQVVIEAKANVTMPDMQISSDVLEFNDVKCGECRVITVQLHNHQHVRCDWNSQPTDRDRKKVCVEKLKKDHFRGWPGEIF